MYVKRKMSPNPITISPKQTILEASTVMNNNGLKRLPVLENGKLVGIITAKDIQALSPSKATSLSVYEINYLLTKATVGDAMTPNVVTVPADALIEEAAVIMREKGIRVLPVMDEEILVGIITESDLIDAFVELTGFKDKGSRLNVRVKDALGVLTNVTRIISDAGHNISHLSVYEEKDGYSVLVIRISGEEADNVTAALKDAGYEIV